MRKGFSVGDRVVAVKDKKVGEFMLRPKGSQGTVIDVYDMFGGVPYMRVKMNDGLSVAMPVAGSARDFKRVGKE